MMKTYYRVANIHTEQGLWYDIKGDFTGLIHNQFDFCKNRNLRMPFDKDVQGWLSATETLEELFEWFPVEDLKRLEKHGWFIQIYQASETKTHNNHLVIRYETSKRLGIISLTRTNMDKWTTTNKRNALGNVSVLEHRFGSGVRLETNLEEKIVRKYHGDVMVDEFGLNPNVDSYVKLLENTAESVG